MFIEGALSLPEQWEQVTVGCTMVLQSTPTDRRLTGSGNGTGVVCEARQSWGARMRDCIATERFVGPRGSTTVDVDCCFDRLVEQPQWLQLL